MSEVKFKKRILFVGIPDMAYLCLDGLTLAGVNIVGVLGPKKNHPTYSSFKNCVLNKNLNFIEYDELYEKKLLKTVRSLDVDAAVVCSFNYKIPKALLDSVKVGFINIHPSLLPNYRGGNPYSSVIANGETETGVTIHFMDENFDTGDAILQQRVDISPDETMGTLFNRLNYLGLQMLLSTLSELEVNDLPRYKQPEGEFISGKNLKDSETFIDYTKSAQEIERFIRSLNPFIIASTTFRSTFMKVFSAEAFSSKDIYCPPHKPGEVAKVDKERFYIATGDGYIAFKVMQFGSFFVGDGKDFLNIVSPKIGESFE